MERFRAISPMSLEFKAVQPQRVDEVEKIRRTQLRS